jgi:hypothetical protein
MYLNNLGSTVLDGLFHLGSLVCGKLQPIEHLLRALGSSGKIGGRAKQHDIRWKSISVISGRVGFHLVSLPRSPST